MRNEALAILEGLVGEWKMTMTNAWFIEDPDFKGEGSATIDWLGEAFLEMRAQLGEAGTWHWIVGRSDPRGQLVLLYHDERGVMRVFDMAFGGGEWTLVRVDPDFHQRFIATVEQDRINGRWEASEDAGKTWRKDFDLTFERRS